MKSTPNSDRRGKHPLRGDGPIVSRAKQSLKVVASQFGEVVKTDSEVVHVETEDGLNLSMTFDSGNYIFSRVYNLKISMKLPEHPQLPDEMELVHHSRHESAYAGGAPSNRELLQKFNARLKNQLSAIDILSSTIKTSERSREISLIPLGGAFVWVLIPPIFKTTAFPVGEPQRITGLFRSIRDFETEEKASLSPTSKEEH